LVSHSRLKFHGLCKVSLGINGVLLDILG
jgi:hypothetical protein